MTDLYQYGPRFRTERAAYEALDNYYASGEVSPEERPLVIKRSSGWIICFREEAA